MAKFKNNQNLPDKITHRFLMTTKLCTGLNNLINEGANQSGASFLGCSHKHYIRLERPTMDKQSSLFDPFISYKEHFL